jgi:cytosine deaminase
MSASDLRFPASRDYTLHRARVPAVFLPDGAPPEADRDGDGCVLVDIAMADGRVARIVPAAATAPDGALDFGGRQVWPTLVDMHTHLDKGHTVGRTPNPDGSFASARDATIADRIGFWDEADLRRRMSFGLACAEAHGVGAIRTHLDSHDDGPHRDQAATSWGVFRDLRDTWDGRVTMQAVGLVPLDVYATDHARRLADIVASSGGLIGGVTRTSDGVHGAMDGMDALLDRLFGLAKERDLDVDLHVDETNDPAAAALEAVARATLRHGYEGRVTCGHCCSLAVQPLEQAAQTIALMAQAGINIVTLPTVNMYLQDRGGGRTPRWRGVTPVHELIAAGIRVAVAGDNCRDAFYAYGDHDMLDTLRQSIRILHFDHPLDLAPGLAGPAPAAAMRLKDAGTIRVGGPADFIILGCKTLNQMVTRSHADRIVIKAGTPLTATPPSYEELESGAAR